jgi:hypothetical protein
VDGLKASDRRSATDHRATSECFSRQSDEQ